MGNYSTTTSSTYSTYYHHTDEESAKQILQSGYIQQSDPKIGDAVFGPGTYLTKLGPDASPVLVAQNNYDGMTNTFWENKIYEGKVNAAIAVFLPDVVMQQCSAGGRDVYRYPGNLNLSEAKQVDVYIRADGSLKKYSYHDSFVKRRKNIENINQKLPSLLSAIILVILLIVLVLIFVKNKICYNNDSHLGTQLFGNDFVVL